MAGLCVLGSFGAFLSFVTVSLTKCPSLHIDGPLGSSPLSSESLPIYGDCNLNCKCNEVAYHPVCSRDGVSVFFSPCHAGCKLANYTEDLSGGGRSKRNLYWDCSCIKKLSEHNGKSPAEPWWTKREKGTHCYFNSSLDAITKCIYLFNSRCPSTAYIYPLSSSGLCHWWLLPIWLQWTILHSPWCSLHHVTCRLRHQSAQHADITPRNLCCRQGSFIHTDHQFAQHIHFLARTCHLWVSCRLCLQSLG